MKKMALAVLALSIGTGDALAADLPARPYAATPMISPIYDWSGFYAGVNGGYGSSRNCWDLVDAAGTFIAFDSCKNATGGTAGIQIGVRTQSGGWVFGVEGQGNWARLRGNAAGSAATFFVVPGDNTQQTRIDAIGLFTGQVGYTFGNALLYLKGGGAVMSARYNDILTATGVVGATATDTRFGGTVGAGLEYGFAPGWSIGVVYDHIFMPTKTYAFTSTGVIPGAPLGGTAVAFDRIRQSADLVTFRINYTFGSPVIAKY